MNNVLKYGNLVSGVLADTIANPVAKVGDEATILAGRDRKPAKVMEIVYSKNGKVKGFMLQEYAFTVDFNTEGYAKEIQWNKPRGEPRMFPVVTHGKLKGTVTGAFIGRADAFYDRSF